MRYAATQREVLKGGDIIRVIMWTGQRPRKGEPVRVKSLSSGAERQGKVYDVKQWTYDVKLED